MARVRRTVSGSLIILLLAQTSACHSWQQTPLPEPASAPGHYRITGRDGGQVEAASVKLVGDTLFAYGIEGEGNAPEGVHWGVGEVARFETRQGDAGKTVGLILGIAVPVVLFLVGAASFAAARS